MTSAQKPASSLKTRTYTGVPHNTVPVNEMPASAQNDFACAVNGFGSGWVTLGFNKRKDVGIKELLLKGVARFLYSMQQLAPDIYFQVQTEGSALAPITSTEPSKGFPVTTAILFQYFFVQLQWTMNDSNPKPKDPKAKGPVYPDQVRGNVFVVSPSGMNVKHLVESLRFDL